jgi:putative acetyltransferase
VIEILTASSPSDPSCKRLLSDLDAYLMALYPPEHIRILSVAELLRREVTFVAAHDRGAVIGCGALVRREGEIKRMYVEPGSRGRRIAETILRSLEELGASEGLGVLRLETGVLQPEALRLYERAGYRRVGPFGDYAANGTSIFMEKRIA